jgi:predicted transcriptional regulator YdeE
MGGFRLAGMNFYGQPFDRCGEAGSRNNIDETWTRYQDFEKQNPDRLFCLEDEITYEIHLYNNQVNLSEDYEVFVGETVHSEALPIELVSKYIPGSEYILLTLVGDEIVSHYEQEIEGLATFYGKSVNKRFIIKRFDERFKGFDQLAESELDILIPVEG